MESFDELLKESTRIHGHICAGQVIGVRMSLTGLREIDIFDPKGQDRKNLYVFVEIDRCATDAIQSVTGCTLGKRSLRWVDNGIMAATFVNLATGRAARITALEDARDASQKYCPEIKDKYKQQLYAYQIMPQQELIKVEKVHVKISEYDLPGRPKRRVRCNECGDWVQDGRDVHINGRTLCRGCAYGRYYSIV